MVEPRARAARADPTRRLAKVLCLAFGLIGALPVALELLLRTDLLRDYVAHKTALILHEQLGVTATYGVRLRLFPLRLELTELVVPASDGGSFALTAQRLLMRPNPFSLLAGQLSVGDVEVEKLRARLVVKNGKLVNLDYRLPQAPQSQSRTIRPFNALAVSDARLDVDIDGTRIDTGTLDLDIFAARGSTFDVMLSATQGVLQRTRPVKNSSLPGAAQASDEDAICRVDLRARISLPQIVVRRLSVEGVLDRDPASRTPPSCEESQKAIDRVSLRLSSFRLSLSDGDRPSLAGHAQVRLPLSLVNRFTRAPALGGWLEFAGNVDYNSRAQLPEVRGRLRGDGIEIDRYRIARRLALDLSIARDLIQIPRARLEFSEGRVVIEGGRIDPFAPGVPLFVKRFEAKNVAFSSLMRDLGVTEDTIVSWDLTRTLVTELKGTLNPVSIDGDLSGETRDFEVFDRAFHDPDRKHMIGVKRSTLRGKIGVRSDALNIYDTRTDFGQSSMLVELVSIGFDNQLKVQLSPGSKLDLSDVSPLIDIPMAGSANLSVKLDGLASDPLLTGNLSIAGFEFGGFPLGDIKSSRVKFRPLWVELSELEGQKGESLFQVAKGRLDFGANAALVAEANVRSESLDLADFFKMWHFDQDPRFDPIEGRTRVEARVRYVLGGPEDRCGGGVLRTTGTMTAHGLSLFDERYSGGHANFDFWWTDWNAGYRGTSLEVPEFVLHKGAGRVSGKLQVTPGARVRGELHASDLPVGTIDTLPARLRAAEGLVNAWGLVSGRLDALQAELNANITGLRFGRSKLPRSQLQVRLIPAVDASPAVGKTRCGQPIAAPFSRAEYDRDTADGAYHVDASLLGGQIVLDDLVVTRQQSKVVSGSVALANLDLGALAELVPEVSMTAPNATGVASGRLTLEALPMRDPALARGTLDLSRLDLERQGARLELIGESTQVHLANRNLTVPRAAIALTSPGGQRAVLDVSGRLERFTTVDAALALEPTPLSSLVGVLPRVERASGTLKGALRVAGPLKAPRASGSFQVERGELGIRGLPRPLSEIDLAIGIDGNELAIRRGRMRFGDGRITLSGGAPISGFSLGDVRVRIGIRDLGLPAKDGIRATADADLLATYHPTSGDEAERTLPRLTGNVTLKSAEYRRPVTMAADLNALAQRGKRTVFESYDPSEDAVEFDLNIKARRTLKLNNDLVEAELLVSEEGLELTGTNARPGLRGTLRVKPGGRIVLRQSEFEITEGSIRFDDPTRIAPKVDVTAVTEYRRYTDAPSGPARGGSTTGTAGSTSASGGRWSIRMHAYGDAENLRVDLTSEPTLPQDDVFLLLTVGLTRAELDQARSASVGESVALEALGTITGADRAVRDALPLIDEFRFGSAYSSRTGRTEPTVAVGKRLTERLRANVTSGLSESREIRSNLEWRLSPRVSVEGSYDNVNDIGSSSFGNLGADIRWRLEFE